MPPVPVDAFRLAFEKEYSNCCRESHASDKVQEFVLSKRLTSWFLQYPYEDMITNVEFLLRETLDTRNGSPIIDNLMSKLETRSWLKVFTIWLKLGHPELIIPCVEAGLYDSRLPLQRNQLVNRLQTQHYLTDEARNIAQAFWELQNKLLTEGTFGESTPAVGHILPITKKKPIVRNSQRPGTEKMFYVEVPCECVNVDVVCQIDGEKKHINEHQDECYEFVLKILDDDAEYSREYEAYSLLRSTVGIVKYLGSWICNHDDRNFEAHILLERGSCDLSDWFAEIPPPCTSGEIFNFWVEMRQIVLALKNFHNIRGGQGGHGYQYRGWHGDIKPQNIVRCNREWRIADMGSAQIRPDGVNLSTDTYGLPVIDLRGATETYAPPEQSQNPRRPVTQLFDIWSLGCVFLEAATWVLMGARGVERFRAIRKTMSGNNGRASYDQKGGDDRFYSGPDVSPAVLTWIEYLKNSLRAGDKVTPEIIAIVRDSMLKKTPRQRASAEALVGLVDKVLGSVKQKLQGTPDVFKAGFKQESQLFHEAAISNPEKATRYRDGGLETSSDILHDGKMWDWSEDTANAHLETGFENLGIYDQRPRGSADGKDLLEGQGDIVPEESTARRPSEPKYSFLVALSELDQEWTFGGSLQLRARQGRPESPLPASALGQPPPPSQQSHGASLAVLPADLSRTNSKSKKSRLPSIFKKKPKRPEQTTPQAQHQWPGGSASSSRAPAPAEEDLIDYQNQKLVKFFDGRDVVFLVDNSSTMAPHSPMLRYIINVLVAMLYGLDNDGMELFFSSHPRSPDKELKEPGQFVEKILARPPGTVTPWAESIIPALKEIFQRVDSQEYNRKLTILVLTDGMWPGITQKDMVFNIISSQLMEWFDQPKTREMMERRDLSIQFIGFGDDPDAIGRLEELDDNMKYRNGIELPDIIDYEHSTGDIYKMIIGSLNEELDGNAATTKRDPTPAASRATAEAPAPSLPAPLYQTTQTRSEWSLAQSNYAPGQSSEWSAPPSSYGPPRLFRGTQPPYTPLSLSMFSTGAPGPPPSSLPGHTPQPQAHTDDPLRQRYSGGSPTSHAPTSYTVSSGSFAAAVPPSAPLSGSALSREPTWGTMGSLQHPMTMDPRNYNQHHSSQYPRYGAQGPQWPQNPER